MKTRGELPIAGSGPRLHSRLRLSLSLLACALPAIAQGPETVETPGKLFAIQKTWVIGGEGNWDYLAFDPAALRLFVAHGKSLQVVDVSAGTLTGTVAGFRDAHGIALDGEDQIGFASDGPANELKVFDMRSLQVLATLNTAKNPRAVVYEPANKLVFVICPSTDPENPNVRYSSRTGQRIYDASPQSTVTVIDAETHERLGDLLLSGKLGFAQADGQGALFVNIADRDQIVSFDAERVADRLRKRAQRAEDAAPPASSDSASGAKSAPPPTPLPPASPTLDWTDAALARRPDAERLRILRLGRDCSSPRSLAIDGHDGRIFVACDNRKLAVVNSETGQTVASLDIGPGADAVVYDSGRNLIFTANGGGLGSLTVIRQHLSDTYAVIQTLPTQQRARTLALNPSSGELYLVTNIVGYDLSKPGAGGSANTLPVVQATPVKGSFQVLVIGN